MTLSRPTRIAGAALFCASAAALADEAHDAPRHRQHASHVHGVAGLDLVVEGGEVHLGLDTPAANLVGFEHAPATEAERQALGQALALLQDGGRLFRFPPEAQCRLAQAVVHTPLVPQGEQGHDGHDEPGHQGEHEHQAGGEHSGEVHADIAAEYRFTCARPELLTGLEVMLFEVFPGNKRLRVQTITRAGQGAVELTPVNRSIAF